MAAPVPRPPSGRLCGSPRSYGLTSPPGGEAGLLAWALQHSLCARRKELFAGPLEELLLRLGDQVPANLGDENWGLEGRREEEVVSKREAQGDWGPPQVLGGGASSPPPTPGPELPAQCPVVQGGGWAGRW